MIVSICIPSNRHFLPKISGPAMAVLSVYQLIDVSKYQPKKVPSLTWCECIKKIWKDDPLVCPECAHQMRIIAFITEGPIIHKILKHLGLWDEERNLWWAAKAIAAKEQRLPEIHRRRKTPRRLCGYP
jgi:hypothetical protein